MDTFTDYPKREQQNHSSTQHQVPEGTNLQITIRTINAIYKRKNKSC